jgi:hypothetical protein
MAAKTYTFRLTSEGVTELENDLKALGPAGQQAFDAIAQRVPGLGESFQQAQAQAEATRKKLEDLGNDGGESLGSLGGAADLAKEALGALGITLSASAGIDYADQVFQQEAALNAQAAAAGVSTDALQAWRQVITNATGDTDTADQMLRRFAVSVGTAKEQAGPARDAFAQLGVSFQDLGSQETALPATAAGLLNVQDAAERAHDELVLFSRQGPQIDSALATLATPTAALVDKMKGLGTIFPSSTADAAEDFAKRTNVAVDQVGVHISGLSFVVAQAKLGLTGLFNEVVQGFPLDEINAAGDVMAAQAAAAAKAKAAQQQQLPPSSTAFTFENVAQSSYPAPDFDKLLSQYTMEAAIAGQTADTRDRITMKIEAANALLHDSTVLGQGILADGAKTVSTEQQADAILGSQRSKQIDLLAAEKARGTEAEKIKETYQQYVDKLTQSASDAGLAVAQQQANKDIIAGAVALQKEQGAHQKDYVTDLQGAYKVLGDSRVLQIASLADQKQINAFTLTETEQLTDASVLLQTNVDRRQLESTLLAQQHKQLGDLTADEIARATAVQFLNDQVKLTASLATLNEQNTVATTVPVDQQQAVLTILQQIHALHGNITADELAEYEQLAMNRQETQRWQQDFLSIRDAEKSAVSELLTTGDWLKSAQDLSKNLGKVISDQIADSISKSLDEVVTKPATDVLKSLVGGLDDALGVQQDTLSSASKSLLDQATNRNSVTEAANAQALAEQAETGSLAAETAATSTYNETLAQTIALRNQAASLPSVGTGGSLYPTGTLTPSGQLPTIDMTSQLSTTLPSLGGDASGLSGLLSQLGGSMPSLGGAAGGGLSGFGISSIISNLIGGSQLGSQIGGTVGGMIGSIWGPVGSAVGSVLGSVAGSFFKGLDKQSNDSAYATFGSNDLSATFGGSEATNKTTQAAQTAASAFEQTMGALEAAGVAFTDYVKSFDIGTRDQPSYKLSNGQSVSAGNKNDPTSVALAAVEALLKTAAVNDAALKQVLTSQKFTSLDQLDQAVSFIQNTYDVIASGEPALNSVQQSMKQLEDDFTAAAQQAQALGLSVTALTQGEAQSFNTTIHEQLLAITDPLQAALDDEAQSAQARLEAAQKFGADINQVEALNAAERAQIVEQYAQQTVSSLQSLIADVTTGSDSPLSPQAQYSAALAAYQQALTQAQATGSQTDIASFASAAQALAPIARNFLGDTSGYGDLVTQILSASQAFEQNAGVPTDAGLAASLASLTGGGSVPGAPEVGTDQNGQTVVVNLPEQQIDFSPLNTTLSTLQSVLAVDADSNAHAVIADADSNAQILAAAIAALPAAEIDTSVDLSPVVTALGAAQSALIADADSNAQILAAAIAALPAAEIDTSVDLSPVVTALGAAQSALIADADSNTQILAAAISAATNLANLVPLPGQVPVAPPAPAGATLSAAAPAGSLGELSQKIDDGFAALDARIDALTAAVANGFAQMSVALSDLADQVAGLRGDERNYNANVFALLRKV